MGTYFEELAMPGHDTALADVEVITDGAELALTVTAEEVFDGEVLVGTGGTAMDNDISHGGHVRAVFHIFEQFPLAHHLIGGNEHGIDIFCHRAKGEEYGRNWLRRGRLRLQWLH